MSTTAGSTTGVTTSVETIAPAKAAQYLATMPQQRLLRRKHVEKLARDIVTDRWHLSGEPIIFNSLGQMIDGQHRMRAVEQANKAATFVVVRGVKPEAMVAIDTGATRNFRDVLTLRGEHTAYATDIAAGARLWFFYDHKLMLKQPALSFAEVDKTLEEHPQLHASAEFIRSLKIVRRHFIASACTFVHAYCTEKYDPEMADLFFTTLDSGQGLKEGDPIWALRRRVVDRGALGRKAPQVESTALLIKTWNAWVDGDKLQRIVWNRGTDVAEQFPTFGKISVKARYTRKLARREAERREVSNA